MDLATVTEMIRKAVGSDSGLGKSIKFDFKNGEAIHVDGANVTNENKPADLELKISFDDAVKMFHGQLDAMSAFTSGKLSVNNPMMAMQLQSKLTALFAKLGK